MKEQNIVIKNMCCQRCVEAVEDILKSLGVNDAKVGLGYVVIEKGNINVTHLDEKLREKGFETIQSEEEQLINKIKEVIIAVINDAESSNHFQTIRKYLQEQTYKPYRFLNSIFVKEMQTTILQYIVHQRINRVKVLIEDGEFSFNEIANLLGYKTPQHLSSQFKKSVGITMVQYKKIASKKSSTHDM